MHLLPWMVYTWWCLDVKSHHLYALKFANEAKDLLDLSALVAFERNFYENIASTFVHFFAISWSERA